MLNLIFQSNPNGKNNAKTSSPSTSSSSIRNETKENQRKCDKSDANNSTGAKSMPSIIAIATIIGSLLMGVMSIFCIIKVEQNAENLFQSFMQNKVFVSRVEKIVQNYIERQQQSTGRLSSMTTGTATATSDAIITSNAER